MPYNVHENLKKRLDRLNVDSILCTLVPRNLLHLVFVSCIIYGNQKGCLDTKVSIVILIEPIAGSFVCLGMRGLPREQASHLLPQKREA